MPEPLDVYMDFDAKSVDTMLALRMQLRVGLVCRWDGSVWGHIDTFSGSSRSRSVRP
jgi:hypothetical protein